MEYSQLTLDERASDQVPVVHVWRPDAAPRGALVVAHGMGEHALRYARLAEAAAARGFASFAPDHRGHGATAGGPERLGDFGEEGWRGLIDDLAAVVERARQSVPEGRVVLLGHSMGSMAVQHYLTESSDRIDAAALSGTTAVDRMAEGLTESGGTSDGGGGTFAAMNAAFAPNRTPFDWLSRDDDEVDRYVADPLCGFDVAEASLGGLMEAGIAWSAESATARVRSDLPIYVFSGDRDPVGGAKGELVALVAERYRKAGVERVTLRLYPEARHELLNETNREAVTEDFLAWASAFLGPDPQGP